MMTELADLLPSKRAEVALWHSRGTENYFARNRRTGEAFQIGAQEFFLLSRIDGHHTAERKYIYVARDGRDVAHSYHHLCRSHLDDDTSFDKFFEHFLKGKVECGSWFKHVDQWWRRRDDPRVLFLRYEDLKRDLEGTIRRIAAFCRIDVSPERLSQILERCGFQFMKQHEDRFDPAMELLWEEGVRLNSFIRNGRIGDGADELSDHQRARFDAIYRRTWMKNQPDPCGSTSSRQEFVAAGGPMNCSESCY